jgi:hypothetical protein
MSSYATGGQSTGGTDISLTIPRAGAYLVVFTYGSNGAPTFDGDTLALLGSRLVSDSLYLKAWGLYDPSTGTHDVIVPPTANLAHALVFDACGAAELAASNSTSGLSVTTNVSANGTDMYVDAVLASYNLTSFAPNAGQTTRPIATYSTSWQQAASYKASSVNSTMGWSSAVSRSWYHIVLRLTNYSPRLARGILIQ